MKSQTHYQPHSVQSFSGPEGDIGAIGGALSEIIKIAAADLSPPEETSEQKAASKLRALAENSLYEFVKQAWVIVEPGKAYVDCWHVKAICDHLQAVYDGKIKNLLITLPPGVAKSLHAPG